MTGLRTVHAMRYITSLREGGSLPALVEGDDGKTYVVKLRGAGQGALALVAEIFTGEIARALNLPVPELVLIDLNEAFGRQEPDPEIQDLFKASRGLNVGMEFVPSVTVFDPASGDVADAEIASGTVWLDGFTLNIDEFINAGVILFSQEIRYLGARVWLDVRRLLALAPEVEVDAIQRHLEAVLRICDGDVTAGPMAQLSQKDRFHWLTAPRSSMLQVSPIRTGLTLDAENTLNHLLRALVR